MNILMLVETRAFFDPDNESGQTAELQFNEYARTQTENGLYVAKECFYNDFYCCNEILATTYSL